MANKNRLIISTDAAIVDKNPFFMIKNILKKTRNGELHQPIQGIYGKLNECLLNG